MAADIMTALADDPSASDRTAKPARRPGPVPPGILSGAIAGPQNHLGVVNWLRLVAAYLAWTGDIGSTRTVWPRVRRLIGDSPKPADSTLHAALPALAIAAETLGDNGLAAQIGALNEGATHADSRRVRASVRFPASADVACSTEPDVVLAPLSALVDGLLGAGPDAVRGRLLLRPAPPADWERYSVRGLRFGEASVDLAYERDGSRHQFRVDQPTGAVPIRVIFEPLVPGRAVVGAWIDGTSASLVPRPHPDGILVPVQIVLDHERSITIETFD
jgi:hypothetical protein